MHHEMSAEEAEVAIQDEVDQAEAHFVKERAQVIRFLAQRGRLTAEQIAVRVNLDEAEIATVIAFQEVKPS